MRAAIDRRVGVMSALAAAEHLVSVCSSGPSSVEIAQDAHFPPGVVGVDLHFWRSTKALTGFALAMGLSVTVRTAEFGDGWFTESTVSGLLDTVPFHAWTRMPVAGPAVVVSLAKSPMAVAS